MAPTEFGSPASPDAAVTQMLHGIDIPASAQVWTRHGTLCAGSLTTGMAVLSRARGFALPRAVTQDDVLVDMIEVSAEALGAQRPFRATRLGADQIVLVRNWRAPLLFGVAQTLSPLERLCDGEFIRPVGPRQSRAVKLWFDAPQVIYVNGLELSTVPVRGASKAAA